jgi:ABC-type glycerol-3-phosphate transport system permease component
MAILIFTLLACILLVIDLFTAYNFIRYRYEGDKTPYILALAGLLFIVTFATTITVYVVNQNGSNSEVSSFN